MGQGQRRIVEGGQVAYDQVMKALKRSGTVQNRKIYARHGASGEMFGVSFGEFGKLRKRIGADQEVAERCGAAATWMP